MNSFRLRLALLSVLLGGLGLAAFGAGTLWLIRDMKLERVDAEIRASAEREVSRTRNAAEWQREETKIAANLGVRNSDELLLLVQDDVGQTLYRSPHWPGTFDTAGLAWPERPDDGRGGERAGRGPRAAAQVIRRSENGRTWHIALAVRDRARIAVAADAQLIGSDMKGVRNAFLVAFPLVLLLLGLGSWLLSDRALRPVRRLTATAQRVTAEGLDQRIASAGEDREFSELIEVFNGMLRRLERSFMQTRRFSADAAHELKTPLAVLQGQLERAIAKADDGSPLQGELTSILDEVRRLSTISGKLLLLSQADAGRLNLFRQEYDLSRTLSDLIEDTRMVAPALAISAEIQPGLVVSADDGLLRQVLHNLLSNAIKYNVEGGWIRIAAARSSRGVEVRVGNASSGIPPEARGRIFDRFYRVDQARSRHVDGSGLGLSVSREIARAHGGDVMLELVSDEAVQFCLLLPANPNQASAVESR